MLCSMPFGALHATGSDRDRPVGSTCARELIRRNRRHAHEMPAMYRRPNTFQSSPGHKGFSLTPTSGISAGIRPAHAAHILAVFDVGPATLLRENAQPASLVA